MPTGALALTGLAPDLRRTISGATIIDVPTGALVLVSLAPTLLFVYPCASRWTVAVPLGVVSTLAVQRVASIML